MKKFKSLFDDPQDFKPNSFKANVPKRPSFDFRGKNYSPPVGGKNTLGLQRDSVLFGLNEHEPKMQTRSVRAKSVYYLFMFGAWNVSIIGFIMYRMRGNDLEDLEKEARERLGK